MKHRAVAVGIVAVATLSVLAGCSGSTTAEESGGDQVLQVAAFEGGYGKDLYLEAAKAFEAIEPGVKVEVTASKTLAQELQPQVAAGEFPDVVILGQGGKEGFTESFIRDKALTDLTDVLDMTVPGEDTTVGDKLVDGVVGNLNTNPYGDDQVYLMPINSAPTGLVYNAGLFAEKGWEVPTTFDEMFALGDEAKAEGISLFTYPTAGYLDTYFFSLLATVGGPDFYRDVMTYQNDVWQSDEATEALDVTYKLLTEYTAPTTVGYANSQDFMKNQQSILDDTALFMPNGTWIANEMKDGPRAADFQWGMAPVPALESGADRYLTTAVENVWVPAQSDNADLAKKFIAFLYSDEVADIFKETGAVQPIKGLADTLTGDTANFYATYGETGVKALVGAFEAGPAVQGVDIKAALFNAADSIVSGSETETEWQDAVNEASNALGAAKG